MPRRRGVVVTLLAALSVTGEALQADSFMPNRPRRLPGAEPAS